MTIPIIHKKASSQGATPTATQHDHVRSALDAALLPQAPHVLQQWCGEIQVSGNEIIMRNPTRNDLNLGSFKPKFSISPFEAGDLRRI